MTNNAVHTSGYLEKCNQTVFMQFFRIRKLHESSMISDFANMKTVKLAFFPEVFFAVFLSLIPQLFFASDRTRTKVANTMFAAS